MSPENTITTATDADRQQAKEKVETRLAVRDYLLKPESIERFANIMGKRDAQFYVNSVIMAVAFKPELADCTHQSILKSALRAATLELSCDEGLHQAQLVPYMNHKTNKKEASLVIHYLGIVNLAQRTGKYRTINYGRVTKNMVVKHDPLSGLHEIIGEPDQSPAIGYFAYYEMNNGYRKSEYMTVEEIHEHAKKFAPSYNSEYSKWKDPKMLPYLEQKTVIRKLMKSADLSGRAGAVLAEALREEDVPTPEDENVVDAVVSPESVEVSENDKDEEPRKRVESEQDDDESEVIPRPLTPTNLKTWLTVKANKIGGHIASPGEIGLMVAMMNVAFAPDPDADKIRRSCIRFLWGVDSSKKMKHPAIKATLDWLHPTQDTGGAYTPDPMAVQELHAVWEAEQLAKGQTTLPGMDKKSK